MDKLKNLTPEQKQQLLLKLKDKGVKGLDKAGITSQETVQIFGEGENWAYCPHFPPNFLKSDFKKLEPTSPTPDQVQVEIHAASLNFRDLMIAMGMYPATPGIPSVMGSDYAGIVTCVGGRINGFNPGDRVFVLSAGSLKADNSIDGDSHFSRYQTVNENQLFHIPDNLSFTDAACIPTVFITSYYALIWCGRLKSTDTVLIHTATGGVGLAAIELCKWKNCQVYATAGNAIKRNLLREMGIPLVMNSRTTDFEKEIQSYTDGKGVDVILNTLSGEAVDAGLNILDFFGRFLQIDKKDIAANHAIRLGNFKKGLSFSGIDIALLTQDHAMIKTIFTELSRLFLDGSLKPVRFKVYPYHKLGDALNYMSRAEHIGKLVIDFKN